MAYKETLEQDVHLVIVDVEMLFKVMDLGEVT